MKILKRERISKDALQEKASHLRFSLPDRITAEQAKEKHLKVYVNMEFNQVIGKEVYDFVFLKAISRRVFNEHGEITNRVYIIYLWSNDELIEAEMPQEEYSNGKWLKKLNTLSVLFMPSKDYLMLIKSFHPEDDKKFYFEKIGVQQLEGKYYYAASNCAVTADGIKNDIQALQKGFDLNLSNSISDFEIRKLKLWNHLLDIVVGPMIYSTPSTASQSCPSYSIF